MSKTITMSDDTMPMGLYFSDADPVARCYVRLLHPPNPDIYPEGTHPVCGWHSHGDSISDAVVAWAKHLTSVHQRDWPDDSD